MIGVDVLLGARRPRADTLPTRLPAPCVAVVGLAVSLLAGCATPSGASVAPDRISSGAPPPVVDIVPLQGLFAIYTAHLADGRSVQAYLDPARAGLNMVHATYFNATGSQLDVADVLADMRSSDRAPRQVAGEKLGPGHFIGYVTLPAGDIDVGLTAVDPDGDPLVVEFAMKVAP